MKFAALLATLFATLMITATASANGGPPNPQDPCADGRNPTTLCDGFEIDEPTAEECPNGGIVVVVGDSRYPVCNGTDGRNGIDGRNGTDGRSGTDGTNGVSTTVTQVVTAPAKTCVSRRTMRVKLPGRFKSGQRVHVNVGGQVSTMTVRNGRVGVSLVGRKCGVYAVAFRRKGVAPFLRLYTAGPAGNVTAYNVPPAIR